MFECEDDVFTGRSGVEVVLLLLVDPLVVGSGAPLLLVPVILAIISGEE